MKPESRKHLCDIQSAASVIRDATDGRKFADYENDIILRSAVERQFEIIGEAMNRLSRTDEATADLITDHQTVIDFRNALAHGYDSVDNTRVWNTVKDHLPVLAQEVDSLLENAGGSG